MVGLPIDNRSYKIFKNIKRLATLSRSILQRKKGLSFTNLRDVLMGSECVGEDFYELGSKICDRHF